MSTLLVTSFVHPTERLLCTMLWKTNRHRQSLPSLLWHISTSMLTNSVLCDTKFGLSVPRTMQQFVSTVAVLQPLSLSIVPEHCLVCLFLLTKLNKAFAVVCGFVTQFDIKLQGGSILQHHQGCTDKHDTIHGTLHNQVTSANVLSATWIACKIAFTSQSTKEVPCKQKKTITCQFGATKSLGNVKLQTPGTLKLTKNLWLCISQATSKAHLICDIGFWG